MKASIVTLPYPSEHLHVTKFEHVIPCVELTEWLMQFGDLWTHYSAKVVHHSYRTRGVIGGWGRTPVAVEFSFRDPSLAMIFKLTWGGK